MSFVAHRTAADDPAAFKATFGRFATGVSVVTCAPKDEAPRAVTISALASVSLDPALAMFCLEERAIVLSAILRAGHFALNILAEDQSDLSNLYSVEHEIRADHETEVWESGAPIFRRALSIADCELLDTFGGGDHVILMGRVLEVGHRDDAAPLVYYGGGYGKFSKL